MNKQIGLVFILAIMVGLIHVFPHFLFQKELGPNYRGLLLLGSPDEENYLIPLREVYEGNIDIANGILAEHKTRPGFWLRSFPIVLTGTIGKILVIDLPDLVIGMDFFLPAIIFLLFFYLSYLSTTNWQAASISSLVAVLAPHIFWPYSRLLATKLTITQPYYIAFLPFSRPINPQLTILPVLLFLIPFYLYLSHSTTKKAIIASIALGASVYFYFFWAYLYPLVGITFLLLLVFNERKLAKGLLFILGASFLVALPAVATQVANFFGEAPLVENIFASAPTRLPIINFLEKLEIATFVFFILAFWCGKIKKRLFIFLASLLLTNLFVMNQQIVTGIIIQPHHYTLFLKPMIYSVILFTFLSKVGLRGKVVKIFGFSIGVLVGLFAIGEGVYFQYSSYQLMKQPYRHIQTLSGIVNFLKQQTPPGAVVLGYINDLTLDQIPIYTHNNLYASLHARHYYLPTQDEFRDRLMNYALVIGYDSDTFAWAISDYGNFHYLFWGFRFFEARPKDNYFTYNRAPLLPQSEADKWMGRYKEKLGKDIYLEVMKYRLDYLLYGPKVMPTFKINPEFVEHLTVAYEDKDWVLYKID